MPRDNIDSYAKTKAGWITTWLVKDVSSADDDEVAATKAAESGKTHFVTFITASCDRREPDIGSTEGGAIKIQLKDGTDIVWEAWVSDINGNTPDFKPATVKQHIYKRNATTPYKYTVRTLSGGSKSPKAIRVWRVA